jgi:hypothetical protein
MHDDARGLVHDQKMGVLVDDCDRDLLRCRREGLDDGSVGLDHLAAPQLEALRACRAVDEDGARA